MKQHTYRVTVEHLADVDGNPPSSATPLVFQVGNHDDISEAILGQALFVRERGRLEYA